MSRPFLGRWTRRIEAPLLLESFFVASTSSFLGIRWFLAATGYPRIGSNGIHIAHMLWGGLLMLLALMCLFAFLDRSVRHLAAVIAGLGFGTFIDEIGKFVTADNDYFYRPAIALIYGVFVVLFLLGRLLVSQRRPLRENEALANALDLLAEHPDGPMEPDLRAEIQRLLEVAHPNAPATRFARAYLAELPEATEHQGFGARLYRTLADAYDHVMAKPWAESAVIVGVVAYSAVLVGAALLRAWMFVGSGGQALAASTIAQLVSTFVGAACVGVGAIRLTGSRMAAYDWFARGVLVWILVTQVFVFYSSQLDGLGGLVIDLIAYAGLRFAMTREVVAGRDRSWTPGSSSTTA